MSKYGHESFVAVLSRRFRGGTWHYEQREFRDDVEVQREQIRCAGGRGELSDNRIRSIYSHALFKLTIVARHHDETREQELERLVHGEQQLGLGVWRGSECDVASVAAEQQLREGLQQRRDHFTRRVRHEAAPSLLQAPLDHLPRHVHHR
jgi:hypothetical protein